jgi:hypothetical protein
MRRLGDGASSLHGKLQHVVSGESFYFDGLPDLPQALEKMMEQRLTSLGPQVESREAGERVRIEEHTGASFDPESKHP